MPSTISDFNSTIKKMHPDVGVATDLTDQTDFNQAKANPYKRQVTLDNTSKTAKTNYLICFKLDTKAIYRNNECAFTFSDLRVYDTDETTELNFWVEAPNTTYTTIFVLVPSIASNSTKNIWLYYGNPALKNKANLGATCGSVFTKSSMVAWFRSNEVNRVLGGGLVEGDTVYSWQNKANRMTNLFQENAGSRPQFFTTSQNLNGLPIMTTGGNRNLQRDFNLPVNLRSGTEVSIFSVVFAPTGSLSNFTSNVRFQNIGGSDWVINHWWNTADSTLKFVVSNDGGTAGINTGVVANTWNVTSAHWKSNTTNGMRTFRNGSLVAQRNSNNSTLGVFNNAVPMRLFSLDDAFEYMNGSQADVLVFSDFLNSTERTQVNTYLNAKYRVYSTSDMPNITVGSQTTTGSTGFSYLSYAPFSSFNSNSEPENKFWGIASTTSKAIVQNVFNKVLVSGSPFESWNNSTIDSSGKLTNQNSRSVNAGTTITVDEVKIERFDAMNNINDLGKFEYSNLIEPNTVYNSTDNDWIEHDFYCEDASKIDVANSYIRFENKNLLSFTETYNNAVWNPSGGIVAFTTGQLDPFGTNRATQINFGPSQFIFQQYLTGYVLGRQFTFSGYLKGVAGQTITIALTSRDAANVVLESAGFAVTLTTDYQRFSGTITLTATSATMNKIQVGFSTFPTATASIVTLAFTQLEIGSIATMYQPRLASGPLSFESKLNKNINILESGRLCVVKIKKSDFTKVGTGTWTDASYILKFGVKTTTGSQSVFYGNFQLKKNFQLDSNFLSSQPIRLRNGVSSDQDSTYFNQLTSEGRITSRLVSSYDITLSLVDYLEIIKDKTFGELDSFPSSFVAFSGDDSEISFGYKRQYHTYFMRKVLGFIFPKLYLDIDLDFLAGPDTVDLFGSLLLTDQFIPNLNYFVIVSTDKIGDVINKLLNTTFGYLTYDQISNKIVARNGYKTWVDFQWSVYNIFLDTFENFNTLPTPTPISQTSIYSYKDESVTDDLLYNNINIQLYKDTLENGLLLTFSDGAGELQASGVTFTFFDRMAPSEILVQVMGNLKMQSWGVAVDTSTPTLDNTGVFINSIGTIGNKIYIEFNNTNTTKRYLKMVNLTGDYVKFTKNNTFYSVLENVQSGELYDFELKDTTSMNKYGKKKYEIDNLYTYAGIDSSAQLKVPNLYSKFLEKWKEPSDLTGIDVQYSPSLRTGQVIKVRNKEGRIITAHVIKNETYSEGEEYTNTISIREIK